MALLEKYVDVFAWTYGEMLGLDPRLVVHSLNVVYQVYALSTSDLAKTLRQFSVSCIRTHSVNEPTHVFHNASISFVERIELWGFIPLGIWLAKKFLRE